MKTINHKKIQNIGMIIAAVLIAVYFIGYGIGHNSSAFDSILETFCR